MYWYVYWRHMACDKSQVSRRSVLKKSSVALSIGTIGLAGCLGDGSNGGNGGGTGTSGGEEVSITFAHPQPPENISVKATQKHFIDVLEKKSNGRITVDLKASSLGGTEDNLDAIEAGTVDMGHYSPTGLSQRFSQKYSFAGDPFVMRGMDHYKKVQEEFLLPEDGFNGILMKNGLKLGDSYYVGNRGYTSNKPVKSPNNVKGMKLRLPQYETWTKVWGGVGASPTPIPYDELYSALQTGVAQASEGPISQFMAKSLYEVQSHFAITNHLLDTKHFLYNQKFLKGLSSEDRKLVTSTAKESTAKITKMIKDEEKSVYEKARNKGTTVVPLDEIDRQAFVDAGMPALKQLSKSRWAVNIEEIQSL